MGEYTSGIVSQKPKLLKASNETINKSITDMEDDYTVFKDDNQVLNNSWTGDSADLFQICSNMAIVAIDAARSMTVHIADTTIKFADDNIVLNEMALNGVWKAENEKSE